MEEWLDFCNETELLELLRLQNNGRIRSGLPSTELVSMVKGDSLVKPEHVSQTIDTRKRLALFIHNPEEYPEGSDRQKDTWKKIKSQLKHCNGVCTKFECTEGQHSLCFFNNRVLLE